MTDELTASELWEKNPEEKRHKVRLRLQFFRRNNWITLQQMESFTQVFATVAATEVLQRNVF